jgi:ribonuclease R
MRLGPAGDVEWYDAGFGVMKSRARLTYERVQRVLDGAEPLGDAELDASIAALETVRARRYALRVERGMLDLDLPETRAVLSPDGVGVMQMKPAERLVAHRLIEECMLVANETIADLLASRGWPAIRRVHGTPPAERLQVLRVLLDVLDVDEQVPESMTAADLNALLASLAGDPRSEVLSWRVLRTLPRATYAVGDEAHFGVGASRYLHFTSPIRRYPDLEVHRVLRRALAGARPDRRAIARLTLRLQESANWSNLGEERAVESERDAARALGALMMRERIGLRFEAVVTDITRFGVFVYIDDPRVDGMIPFSGLGRERFEVVEEGVLLEGAESGRRLVVGDRIPVRCTSVDLLRGRVGFVAEQWGTPGAARAGGRGRKHSGGGRPVRPPARRRR